MADSDSDGGGDDDGHDIGNGHTLMSFPALDKQFKGVIDLASLRKLEVGKLNAKNSVNYKRGCSAIEQKSF